MSKIIEDFWGAVIGVLFAAGTWLVTRIIQMDARFKELQSSHEMQMELLKSEFRNRDDKLDDQSDRMGRVETDVREIRNAILGKNN